MVLAEPGASTTRPIARLGGARRSRSTSRSSTSTCCRAATQNRTADVSVNVQQQAGANRANPYAAGLPDSVQQALAKRYADLFAVFVKHRGRHRPGNFLGSWRRRFVAQQLADARPYELSVTVRSAGSAETGVRSCDERRAPGARGQQMTMVSFITDRSAWVVPTLETAS